MYEGTRRYSRVDAYHKRLASSYVITLSANQKKLTRWRGAEEETYLANILTSKRNARIFQSMKFKWFSNGLEVLIGFYQWSGKLRCIRKKKPCFWISRFVCTELNLGRSQRMTNRSVQGACVAMRWVAWRMSYVEFLFPSIVYARRFSLHGVRFGFHLIDTNKKRPVPFSELQQESPELWKARLWKVITPSSS